MSAETEFARAAFPELRDGGRREHEARERVRGHAAGHAAGFREASRAAQVQQESQEAEFRAMLAGAEQRTQQALDALGIAVTALNQRVAPVLGDVQDAFIESAFELVEAIVGYELQDPRSAARAAVDRVLAIAEPTELHRIRMHPGTLAALNEQTRQESGVVFAADPQLTPGDAVADLADGYVDARISTSLARARTALLGER
ncbi:FliH/SctL family protein [Arthrobacter roseus]|uniref:FliH/SctL family protein n=1 Tax=Arthrobacter roseus TaxID=136274 RepID=UPI001962A7A2|nr:FliH/SctL family protein [Arthrobacter roseus]MBM7847661.1 flagellar assembly protein FliH [Arthrobacter roseus]